MLTILQATTDEHIRQVQALFAEYFEFLRSEVDTHLPNPDDAPPVAGFRNEMVNLPGRYAPPDGRLLLAQVDGEAAGCVALYKFGDGVGEVKRLWARPQFRGMKVGRRLVESLIEEARQIGYTSILLSTVDKLTEAQSLYTSLGWELTEPYFDGPEEMMAHEIFMKLELCPFDNPSEIEKDFLESWDFVERHFKAYGKGWEWLNPMFALIAQFREQGYDRHFRAGQSIYHLVISRSRKHGLRLEQQSMAFIPHPDGSMSVCFYKISGQPTIIEVDRMELTPEIEPLLQKLLEQPID
ncbi:MAG: hypothetical protein BroJett018_45870 [Chloroflexota bacterium]|nr:MAG: hypothetical protein BroJett018_45870 [Chloroflexota bacterium]